jgi:diamine N-acetyltransferase
MLENATHRLRAIEPEDVDNLLRWENDSESWWLGASITPYSKATLLKFATGDHDLYRDRQMRFMLDYKNTQGDWSTVGAIDVYDFDVRNQRAGIGVIVDAKARRNGHASVGLNLIANYTKVHLGLHLIYAEVPAKHEASINLFQKSGYQECELRKQWVKGVDGWEDVILMQFFNRGNFE